MKTVVSEKGQITIPKPIRTRLGLRVGEIIQCREKNGLLILQKVFPKNPVDQVYGILKQKKLTDNLIRKLRGNYEE